MAQGYYICLYPVTALPSPRSMSAAPLTGSEDGRRIALYAPAELTTLRSLPASTINGINGDNRRIELYPLTERPSDVPAGNFIAATDLTGIA